MLLESKAAYTVREIATLTGWSVQTVRRLFEREAGVLILDRPSSGKKRRYRSMRIPRAVYQRVVGKVTTYKRGIQE